MRRLLPRRANDAPQKPRSDTIMRVLVSLGGHLGKPWLIVTQEKLLERLRESFGYVMSRRSLNRHLSGMERDQYINRKRRHIRLKSGKIKTRATLYTFAQFGILWINRARRDCLIPLGSTGVPKVAQSRNPLYISKSTNVDKASTFAASSPPRKRGGTNGPPVNRRLSASERAMQGQGRALSRGEAQLLDHRPRKGRSA